jgi:hypothetical protein
MYLNMAHNIHSLMYELNNKDGLKQPIHYGS